MVAKQRNNKFKTTIIVLLVMALVLVFTASRVVPNTNSEQREAVPRGESMAMDQRTERARDATSPPRPKRVQPVVVAGSRSQQCDMQVKMLLSDDDLHVESHQPPHIAQALEEWKKAAEINNGGAGDVVGSNTVQVSSEDVARAEANVIEALPAMEIPTADSGGATNHCRSIELFNAVKDSMQRHAFDASPIIVDFGCSVGLPLATAHKKSTVVCAVPHGTKLEAMPDPAAAVRHGAPELPSNLLWIGTTSKGFVEGKSFTQIYESCNMITIAFALGPEGGFSSDEEVDTHLKHLELTVPSAALTFTVVPKGAVEKLHQLFESGQSQYFQKHNVTVELEQIAELSNSQDGAADVLLRISLKTMSRPCRKTFGAPLIQWDREQSVSFNNGRVSFRVSSVGKKGAKVRRETMRVIHPLQYIPSLNLDTMLGLGLDEKLRHRLMGQMIATPRYSDPLPHNWVLGGVGHLFRIDKVDLRYDKDVDESKGYWGTSTRGYLHLLGYHLCLALKPNGLPVSVQEGGTEDNGGKLACYNTCKMCAEKCSYLPKASQPCPNCNVCGLKCIGNRANKIQTTIVEEQPKCQKTYGSMDSARKVWKKWKGIHEKNPL